MRWAVLAFALVSCHPCPAGGVCATTVDAVLQNPASLADPTLNVCVAQCYAVTVEPDEQGGFSCTADAPATCEVDDAGDLVVTAPLGGPTQDIAVEVVGNTVDDGDFDITHDTPTNEDPTDPCYCAPSVTETFDLANPAGI